MQSDITGIADDAFLRLNGLRIEAEGIEFGEELRSVVDTVGSRAEVEPRFREWLRSHVVPYSE